jgi:hypothetical protein
MEKTDKSVENVVSKPTVVRKVRESVRTDKSNSKVDRPVSFIVEADRALRTALKSHENNLPDEDANVKLGITT